MSKSLLIFGSSVGAAGCVGAAGVVYWKSTSGTSFKDRFEKEIKGRILLDVVGTKHDVVWDALVEEYKADHKGRPDIEGIVKESLDRSKLKTRCGLDAKLSENSKFKAYVDWCSRNTLKTQFNTSVKGKVWNDSKVVGDWTAKKNGYAQDSDATLQIPEVRKADVTEQKIMNWCDSKIEFPFVKDNDETYKRADTLCTK